MIGALVRREETPETPFSPPERRRLSASQKRFLQEMNQPVP